MAARSVYVSYSWTAEEQTQVVDKLGQACAKRGIEFRRDKDRVGYGDSIRAYMDELAAGSHVVLVLSDPYFKSENCMYELREIYNNKDFRKRVYPIVLAGASIHKPVDRVRYLRHWQDEISRLQVELGKLEDPKYTKNLRSALDDYADFRRLMDELQAILADMNTLTEGVHVSTDFEALLDRLSPNQESKPSVATSGDDHLDLVERKRQEVFEERICAQVKVLLSKPSLREFTETLAKVVVAHGDGLVGVGGGASGDRGAHPPLVDSVMAWLWKPDAPVVMINDLHKAAAEHLRVLRDRGRPASETDDLWGGLTRILGHVATCAVSRAWLESHGAAPNPYHDIPVERLAAIEIVLARLAEAPASLGLTGTGEVQAPYRVSIGEEELTSRETFIPESGWQRKETVGQIEAVIYRAVLNESKVRLTDVDRDYLNEMLKIYREDPGETRNYHVAVERNQDSHPLRQQEIAEGVKKGLPELPIILFGPGKDDPVLIVPEGQLIARLRHFLNLIHRNG